MSASQQTILGLLCVPCGTRQQMAFMPSLCRTKHNRAKPMSELASALFSIADANEFRFARFYIVCEAVLLGTLGNPLIVCGLSDTFRGVFKTWKRHGIRCKNPAGRNAHIFLQRIFHLHFPQKSAGCTSYHIPSHIKKGLSAQSGNPFFPSVIC